MNELINKPYEVRINEALFLREIPSESQTRRFMIENPQEGLPREAIEAVQKNRIHFLSLLEPEKDVGIKAKCEPANGHIRVSQTNLDRAYTFSATNGEFIE